MKPEDIEFFINHWKDLAGDYREQADKFNVLGFESADAEFRTIANTLERCANDLKKNRHWNDG